MRSTSLRVGLAAASLLAVVSIASAGTSAGAAPACTAAIVPPSGAASRLLLAVTGNPDAAVAMGVRFEGGSGHPLITRESAGVWADVRTSMSGRAIQLQDAVTDGVRTWGVGAFRNREPVAGWLQGTTWTWSEPADPGGVENELLGVTVGADGTVWAVGKYLDGHTYVPLAERFDGRAWTIVDTPAVDGSAVLKDVAAEPDGTIWAVGWSVHDDGVTRPLIERFDGSSWTVERVDGEGLLSGIAVSPGGTHGGIATAVGWRDGSSDPATAVPIAWRWSGSRWTELAAPAPAGRLIAVAALGDGVVGVGTVDDETGVPQPLILRDLGGTWTRIVASVDPSVPPAEPGGDQLWSVTASGEVFTAVGTRDTAEAFSTLIADGSC